MLAQFEFEDEAMGVGWVLGTFAVYLIFGIICAAIAHSRGRNAVGWFFIGVFGNCIGLILVLVLPDLKIQQEREQRLVRENRRLRETQRKDRMVADQRHAATEKRLGAHDHALGVDTAEAAALPGQAAPPSLPPAHEGTAWYYASGADRRGPVDVGALQDLWNARAINEDSLVWREGMGDWQRLGDVEDLRDSFGE